MGLDYLKQSHNDRRNLILFSDGGDNASRATLKEVTNRTQASNVVIYAVALTDADEREANPKLLERLARATGGRRISTQGRSPDRGSPHTGRTRRQAYLYARLRVDKHSLGTALSVMFGSSSIRRRTRRSSSARARGTAPPWQNSRNV